MGSRPPNERRFEGDSEREVKAEVEDGESAIAIRACGWTQVAVERKGDASRQPTRGGERVDDVEESAPMANQTSR